MGAYVLISILILLFCSVYRFLLSLNNHSTFISPRINIGNISSDVSCHWKESNDSTMPIANEEIFPEKSIFFHETSCKGGINSREACAVESAARNNPEWQINLLFSGPLNVPFLEDKTLEVLRNVKNVKIARIHDYTYAKGTPGEIYLSEASPIQVDKYRVYQKSDILRFTSLYKHGGIYLDTDVITVKSFDKLPKNWVAKDGDDYFSSATMGMSKDEVGRKFTETALRKLANTYEPNEWGCIGPKVVAATCTVLCETGDIRNMSTENCNGIEIFWHKYFNPINYENARQYFEPIELTVCDQFEQHNLPYTHHMWNRMSHSYQIEKTSYFYKIAQRFCPSTVEFFGEFFGK